MDKFRKLVVIFLKLAVLGTAIFALIAIKDDVFTKPFSEVEKVIRKNADGSNIPEEIIKTEQEIANKIPEPIGEVDKTFQWKYRGKTYSFSQKLYSSIYDFYKSQPKTYTYFSELPPDWEEEYYGMFLARSKEYDFVAWLLDSIVEQGKKNSLSEDQMVELVLAFVQSIPYDEQKASLILSGAGGGTINYPYETLFENKGVCSDKSFLAISLLRQLGYGTAIFVYEGQNHMAIGIQCPMQYSNYQSGYCYGETTAVGNKIGIIPELKAYAGMAVGGEEISYFKDDAGGMPNSVALGEVKILQKTSGGEYRGIIQTISVNNEISVLKKEIEVLGAELKTLKSKIGDLKEDLDKSYGKISSRYEKNGDAEEYNDSIKEYNKDLEEYKDKIDEYNKKVKKYNEKVERYNYLIKL